MDMDLFKTLKKICDCKVTRKVTKLQEAKVNEEELSIEDEEEPAAEETSEVEELLSSNNNEEIPEESPEEKEEVSNLEKISNDQEEKAYLGKTEADKYYYLVDNNGTLKVVDAIGEDVEEVKDVNSSDPKQYLEEITQKLNIVSLDPGIVNKYVLEPAEEAQTAEEVTLETPEAAMPAEPLMTPEEKAVQEREPLATELGDNEEVIEDEEELPEEDTINDSRIFESLEAKIEALQRQRDKLRDRLGVAKEKRKLKKQHVQGPAEIKLAAAIQSLDNEMFQLQKQADEDDNRVTEAYIKRLHAKYIKE